MDRKQKRKARRTLRYQVATLSKLVNDPVAVETGCNVPALMTNLFNARRELRQLNY